MTYNFVYSEKNKLLNKSKNLLAGKWLFNNLLKKEKTNVKYCSYHWNNKEKQIKDFKIVKKIYDEVIKDLSINLNEYHSKRFSVRQWEILLFFFLHQYILAVYDRLNLIKSIKKKFKLKPIQLISYKPGSFICEESRNMYDLMISNEWNDWIFSEIIKEQKLKYYNFKYIKKRIFKEKKEYKTKNFFGLRTNNNFLFLNLELPKYQKILLNILVNQFNFPYLNINLSVSKNKNLKKRNFKKNSSRNEFTRFIIKNLEKVLPKSYLENFEHIEQSINYLNWPKKPKIIMTSYSHYHDEVFKIYTAQKIRSGSKLVILQHGHQGHHDLCGTYFEKRVCDKYLSWGNRSKDKKVIPLFLSTNIGKKVHKKKPNGILIKITEFQLIPWKSTHAPWEIESVIKYRENLNFFLNNLNEKIKKITTIKSFDHYNTNFITKDIKKNFKGIKINKVKRIKGRGFEEANEKQIIVETFNSTGFIELLSMNSPVILLTTKPLFYVKKEYKKYYDALIKNKIIFFNPKEAAEYVNLNLSRIEEWWLETNRQKGIKFFCDNMCKYENNVKKLSSILKKIAS